MDVIRLPGAFLVKLTKGNASGWSRPEPRSLWLELSNHYIVRGIGKKTKKEQVHF